MSIPVEQLTKNDYKILEYINRFPSVHKSDIEKHFNGKIKALDYRLSVLAAPDRSEGRYGFIIPNSNYIIEEFKKDFDDYSELPQSLNMFHISDFGKSVLQDYRAVSIYNNLKTIASILTLIASIIAAVAAVISALK